MTEPRGLRADTSALTHIIRFVGDPDDRCQDCDTGKRKVGREPLKSRDDQPDAEQENSDGQLAIAVPEGNGNARQPSTYDQNQHGTGPLLL